MPLRHPFCDPPRHAAAAASRPSVARRVLAVLAVPALLLVLSGCTTLSPKDRAQAVDIAEAGRSTEVVCGDGCRIDSPLLALGANAVAASTPGSPRHHIVLLDRGQDALLARVHLIRAARRTIDLQSFIFESDDAGRLVLDELLAAARRGVKVRVLLDQLYGLPDPNLQATLAGMHENFELRLYNPTFGEAKTQTLEYAAGVLFSFRKFNQRMHTKLLLVDDVVGVTGGRNIQDRYFDWAHEYNYRDRDIVVAGPVAKRMAVNFDAFWDYERTQPAETLADVAQRLIAAGAVPANDLFAKNERSPRVRAMAALAADGAATWARLQPLTMAVGRVDFFADLPEKHEDVVLPPEEDASLEMRNLVSGTQRELVLQTPYLVLSREARNVFRELDDRDDSPEVIVSTNSLAATDAFPVYAMSFKYKRLYLADLGFQIFEYKPYPGDAPIDLAATGAMPSAGVAPTGQPRISSGSRGATGSASGMRGSSDGMVPLERAGVRIGLHAKSMVVDDAIGIVGSHNFDPRSDNFNTESMVVVHDAEFAAALEASIRRDMKPENAWTIARTEKPPVFSGLNYSLGKLSEKLPIFDIWPFPYATSFELKPGCQPLPPDDPRFYECYEDVGKFPEVALQPKTLYTRILRWFGAGLVPIL